MILSKDCGYNCDFCQKIAGKMAFWWKKCIKMQILCKDCGENADFMKISWESDDFVEK